jgi:hypothetical protein
MIRAFPVRRTFSSWMWSGNRNVDEEPDLETLEEMKDATDMGNY